MKTNSIVVERITTESKLFAQTRWDAIPVAAGLLHCAYFFLMFYLVPRVPLWLMIVLGLIYSISISWNINGISHNFIHSPYFRSPVLNRLISILESITVGFSQVFYECIHMQHHKGNADLPDQHGETVDWISIYKHGHDGDAEHPFKYAFLQLLPGGSEDRVPGTEAQRSTGGSLGCPGTHALCGHLCHSWRPQM